MEDFKYLIDNSVLIKHKWENNTSQLIQVYNLGLETKLNYITKAIKVSIEEEKFGSSIKEGDTLFLSRYLVSCKKFRLDESYINCEDYSNIPVKLILGRFNDGMLNIGSLEMFFDKVLIEPIKDLKIGSILLTENSACDIGRVVKRGNGGLFRDYTRRNPLVEEGDVILYWNNTSTPITLASKPYSAIEDGRIIGIFKDGVLEMENLQMLDGRILLKDMEEEKLDLTSKIILPAKGSAGNDFELQSNAENNYEVFKIGERGKEYRQGLFLQNEGIKEGDTLVVKGDYLQHVFFKSKKYYTLDDVVNCAEAVIKKEEI
jgi:co-chaperonin GroES (HSP10)